MSARESFNGVMMELYVSGLNERLESLHNSCEVPITAYNVNRSVLLLISNCIKY